MTPDAAKKRWLLTTVLASLIFLVAACSDDADDEEASEVTITSTTGVGSTPEYCGAGVEVTSDAEPPCGEGVDVGAGVPYELLLRCGVAETIVFDGRLWLADPMPSKAGETLVIEATEHEDDPDYASGTMTLASEDAAHFETDWGLTLDFKPVDTPVTVDC